MRYSNRTERLMKELEELKQIVFESQLEDENREYEIFHAREELNKDMNSIGFKMIEINPIDLDATDWDVSVRFEKNDIYCTLWFGDVITLDDGDIEFCTIDMYSYNYDHRYGTKYDVVSKLEERLTSK